LKHLFIDSNPATFSTKQTIIELNSVRISAIPLDHLDDARGIPNVSFFYSDETAFYSNKKQDNLIGVSQRYILKSNPWIVFVSTPNKDGDIMHKISLEKDSLWTKLYFDYRVAVNHMWTPQEVEHMKCSPSFPKEYDLKFGYGTSTIFNAHDIDFITSGPYDTSEETCTSPYFTKWLAIDPGWGGSNTEGIFEGHNRDNLTFSKFK
jgi:hypothetical protein